MEVLKYRVNGMIAPKYDLPIYTRGNIHLSTAEATAIFENSEEADFARIKRARLGRVQPPFTSSVERPGETFTDELGLF
jgi:hypothetical protein